MPFRTLWLDYKGDCAHSERVKKCEHEGQHALRVRWQGRVGQILVSIVLKVKACEEATKKNEQHVLLRFRWPPGRFGYPSVPCSDLWGQNLGVIALTAKTLENV